MNNTDEPYYGMQFVPCCSCGMFQLMNHEEFLLLRHHSFDEDEGSVSLTGTCYTCQEKLSLLATIDDLNKIVSDLNMRIETLTAIRDLETEIDQSALLNLSCKQNNVSFSLETPTATHILCELANDPNDKNRSSCAPLIEELNSATATLIDSTLDTNNTHDQYDFDINDPNENNNLIDLNIITNLDAAPLIPVTDSKVSLDHEVGAGILKTGTVTVNSVPTPLENIEGSTPQDQEKDTLPIVHASHTVGAGLPNHNKSVQQLLGCDNVKTMLLGDRTFQYADINRVQSCQENEFFRVARAESKLGELVETADFLVDNLYTNVRRAVFHVGMNDLKAGNTELLKEKIDNIIIKMAKRDIVPVISGPIPFFGMPGELFSRLCCINDWLIKMSTEKHMLFINNFPSFWGRKHLFMHGMLLSQAGNRRLVDNISTFLSTVAPIEINPTQ